jgi:histidine triad (HIT) family protein
VIPKQEIPGLSAAADADQAVLGHLLLVVRKLAGQQGLAGGYRVVINDGLDAGQTVPHLHLHLIGGRPMGWPPG